MTAIERLEKWKAGHKSRSASISIDDGYGASCWTVSLRAGSKLATAHEVCFWEDSGAGWPENVVFVNKQPDLLEGKDEDDWPGLEKTILAAVDLAERLGI